MLDDVAFKDKTIPPVEGTPRLRIAYSDYPIAESAYKLTITRYPSLKFSRGNNIPDYLSTSPPKH